MERPHRAGLDVALVGLDADHAVEHEAILLHANAHVGRFTGEVTQPPHRLIRHLHEAPLIPLRLRHRQHLAGEHEAAARLLDLHVAMGQQRPREAEDEVCREAEALLDLLPCDALRMGADEFKHRQRPVEGGRLVARVADNDGLAGRGDGWLDRWLDR